ncbi:hypothetical protein BpHYR1_039860 [Brachionus plicatilis]|uniref:Uncharacterized protein n=1 Tax=Brachionus plicatilis TaxID=10195 RepID=A0A3M7RKJ8_BRAPC|nr:hypothetical protein BpHYR1_039860 [Brachionus plicatilis]
MHNQDTNTNTKGAKTRKKSFDIPDGSNPKISSKLLKILKDNQEEFSKDVNDQPDLNQIEPVPSSCEMKYSSVKHNQFKAQHHLGYKSVLLHNNLA